MNSAIAGRGSATREMTVEELRSVLAARLDGLALDGRRLLVIIPDGTRTAPIPLVFSLLHDLVGHRVARLDYLIALGTHPPMSAQGIGTLVGVPTLERLERYPKVRVFNHRWDIPSELTTVGTISSAEMARLTGGLVSDETPVRLNRAVLECDQILICGPVFPHEVVGFSGGAKYLAPGIAGSEIIDATHWLGALATCMNTIGVKDTPVRRVIHRAAEFVPRPVLCLALVMRGSALHGAYLGNHLEAYEAAADLSAQLNIITVPRQFRRVLAMPSTMYDDLWTAAKAMYKTEPAVAEGGEVIIWAPHIVEVSYTHGSTIDRIGYHVRDYFLKQWHRFRDVPGTILAHSTHVKGDGSYELTTGLESLRIQVTLATGIPEERCRRINLGYADYRSIEPADWANRENEGILLVPRAGEMLYRTH